MSTIIPFTCIVTFNQFRQCILGLTLTRRLKYAEDVERNVKEDLCRIAAESNVHEATMVDIDKQHRMLASQCNSTTSEFGI